MDLLQAMSYITFENQLLGCSSRDELFWCKPATSPLEGRPKFWDTDSPMMADANHYWHLLGKLIYLIVTCHDITYVVSLLSQFMQEPCMVHLAGTL